MQKMITVVLREYLTRIRTKGFILGTILLPLLMLAMVTLPTLLMFIRSEDQKNIAVIDLSDQLYDALVRELDQTNDAGERIYRLHRLMVKPENLEPVKETLKQEIADGKRYAYIIIPRDVLESNRVEVYAKNVSGIRVQEDLRTALTQVIREKRILAAGLDPEFIQKVTKRVDLRMYKVGPGGEEREEKGQTFVLAYVMLFFLYMALILYGTFVMRSIIEEKNSRVVEVLVSSVRPFHLMAGKIFGIGSVGLTQFFIWSVAAGLIGAYSGLLLGIFGVNPSGGEIPMPDISIAVLIYFVLYFVLGYLLYATLFAAVGAMVNSEQEAQQFQTPVVMFLVVPMILMTFVLNNPHSTTNIILSLIPFFSPMLMFMRIVVEMPPFYEIFASIALLIGTILLMVFLVGKIFRVGILMYGKRPTIPEILRWLRYS